MKRWLPGIAWFLLALGGATSWGIAIGWLNPVHPPDLMALPEEIGPLRTLRIYEVDSGLLGDLPPDRFTFRQVGDGAGHEGEMYLAYFERGRRWSGRPHDLETCYRSGGWQAEAPRTLQTPSGARLSAQDFTKDGERIRVFHWIQQPGLLPGSEGMAAQLRRMFGPAILRQDMASIYLQFPAAQAPADESAIQTTEALIRALEALWSASA